MTEAIKRNVTLLGGMAICGLVLLQARGSLLSPTGSSGPSILHATSVIGGCLSMFLWTMLATVVAVAVGRIINSAVGLFVLGSGLFALSYRLDGVNAFAMGDGSRGLLAVETLLFAALVLLSTIIMFVFAGPLRDIEPLESERPSSSDSSGAPPSFAPRLDADQLRAMLLSPNAWIGAAAGFIVLPIVWVVARSPMVGQTVGAVIVGGIVAGLVGRLVRPNVQPLLLFVTPVLAGAVGHLLGSMGSTAVSQAMVTRSLSPFTLPMPIHYAAGSLIGVSMGIGWAKSFLHHEEPATATTAVRAPAAE